MIHKAVAALATVLALLAAPSVACPDFRLQRSGSSAQMTIAIEAGADVVLPVDDPDVGWHYSDDYRGTNSAITFFNPVQRRYHIRIGSHDGSRRNPARLVFTEFDY